MKRLALLFSFFIFSSFRNEDGNGLPSVVVKSSDGKSHDIREIENEGKPMIVSIWEVSCKPCIQEFDNISRLYDDWQKETGVKLIAISVDDNRNYSKAFPLVKSKGWDFEFYQDKNQDVKRALSVPNCPFTVILDGKGEIVWRKSGYLQGDEHEMYDIVKKLHNGEAIEP